VAISLPAASLLDVHIRVELRRGPDDPVPDVFAEMPLQLLDALGQSPIRGDDDLDRPGSRSSSSNSGRWLKNLLLNE
jgi:hypothetical protein